MRVKLRKLTRAVCLASATAMFLAATGCGNANTNKDSETTINKESTSEKASEKEVSKVSNTNAVKVTDKFEQQKSVDEQLKAELKNDYTIDNPSVIVNPYGNSPLTAVIVFKTDESVGGTITVKGKNEKDDIKGTIEEGTEHIVPVYGLYNNDTTKIEIALDNGQTKTVEATTEDVGLKIGDISVDMKDESSYDYGNLTIAMGCTGSLYALDSAGDVRWYFAEGGTLGVHQLKNGHLMIPTKYVLKKTYYKSGLQEMDLTGRVYNEYAIPGGMHHDFQELPNGNLLVASDAQDLSQVEDQIVEIDRKTGEVVWELDMSDLIDENDGQSATLTLDGVGTEDWFHNNSLWYDEKNDLVLLSGRHKDAIVAVKKSDKTLAWVLGDPNDWEKLDKKYFFTPQGDDFEWFYGQHQITMLDNGDIMLFDNGSAKVKASQVDNKVTGKNVYSRAVVYHIDTENMTVTQEFEYGKERGDEWYSDWISGVISLDGTQNNLWITAGSNLYNPETDSHDYGPSSMFVKGIQSTTHIDSVVNGKLTYEIKITGEGSSSLTYRTLRMPMYNEGANLSLEEEPKLMGSLGKTKTVEADVKLDGAETLPAEGWTFENDGTKFTVTGSYSTQTEADKLGDGYLVLKNDKEQLIYPLSQTGTKGESDVMVNVSGWVGTEGLSGNQYDVYLVMDGKTYNTGSYVEF